MQLVENKHQEQQHCGAALRLDLWRQLRKVPESCWDAKSKIGLAGYASCAPLSGNVGELESPLACQCQSRRDPKLRKARSTSTPTVHHQNPFC